MTWAVTRWGGANELYHWLHIVKCRISQNATDDNKEPVLLELDLFYALKTILK